MPLDPISTNVNACFIVTEELNSPSEQPVESTNYGVIKSTNSETQTDAVLCHSIEQQCPNTCKLKMCDSSTQTENFVTIENCYAMLRPKSKSVGIQHCSRFGVDIINTDSEARFYTGLAFPIFNTLVNTISEFGENSSYRLPIPDQILLTLMRLRLGLAFQDLGTTFGISHQLCSNIFSKWIDTCKTVYFDYHVKQ